MAWRSEIRTTHSNVDGRLQDTRPRPETRTTPAERRTGLSRSKPRPKPGRQDPDDGLCLPDARLRCKTRSSGGCAALPTAPTTLTRRRPKMTSSPNTTRQGRRPERHPTARQQAKGQVAVTHGAADVDIDLGWLPEPGRTQAMSGRAAAYDDTGRCAYHLSPFGCALVDGNADGPGLIELNGLKPARPTSWSPEMRPGSPTRPPGARPSDTPNGAGPSAEVRKRSANLVTWCERCAIGIRIRCADDHANRILRRRPHRKLRC